MQPRNGRRPSARSFIEQHASPGEDRIDANPRAGFQIAFQFAATKSAGSNAKSSSSDAAAALTQTLQKLYSKGHAAVPEQTVLVHAAHQSRFAQDLLTRALRHAIRQRQIAREQIDDVPLLFLSQVRDAELTVARCVRQIAEGPPLIRSDRARLEKLSLLCSSAPLATLDVLSRLLTRLSSMDCRPTLLVQGSTEAQWFRWKLGHRVLEIREWSRHVGSPRRSDTQASIHSMFIVLDSSRLGLEMTAEVLEAIPQEASLMLVGDPNESPTSGHGQPFRDLVSTALFQCVNVKAATGRVENALTPAPLRRSALSWRLRRSAGLNSNLRWGPIATIGIGDAAQGGPHDLQR